jgi:hypothetical protein
MFKFNPKHWNIYDLYLGWLLPICTVPNIFLGLTLAYIMPAIILPLLFNKSTRYKESF